MRGAMRGAALGSTARLLKESFKKLMQGEMQTFKIFLETFLRDYASCHDTARSQPEKFYHGLLMGLLATFTVTYELSSDKESGKGRYDIALFPKKPGRPGVIFEIKVAKGKEDLKELAQKAHTQIIASDYAAAMRTRNIKTFFSLGVAFRGEEVAFYEKP